MKIAVVGAGVAGLSCAYELENYGVKPEIYEDDSFIGDPYDNVACFLEITHRPVRDALGFLKNTYNINLRPLNTINTLVHHAPNENAIIHGRFGYFIERGKGANSLHQQLLKLINGSILHLNAKDSYKSLIEKNDYVIVSNGNNSIADESGCWKEYLTGLVKSATVYGNFDPNSLIMWVNRDYCRSGYAYLAPYDNKKAALNLIVPHSTKKELEQLWDLFLTSENIKYEINSEVVLKKSLGQTSPLKNGNILFAGDAGGAADPFLGFGQLNSIVMGIMAARSVMEGKDYETLVEPVIKSNQNKYQFRKAMSKATNKEYDSLINFVDLPGIKQLIYNSPINIIKCTGNALRVLNTKIRIKR